MFGDLIVDLERRLAASTTWKATPGVKLIDSIVADAVAIASLRRDVHAHPEELSFEALHTAALVARKLTEWGIPMHQAWPRPASSALHGRDGGAVPGKAAPSTCAPTWTRSARASDGRRSDPARRHLSVAWPKLGWDRRCDELRLPDRRQRHRRGVDRLLARTAGRIDAAGARIASGSTSAGRSAALFLAGSGTPQVHATFGQPRLLDGLRRRYCRHADLAATGRAHCSSPTPSRPSCWTNTARCCTPCRCSRGG